MSVTWVSPINTYTGYPSAVRISCLTGERIYMTASYTKRWRGRRGTGFFVL